MKVHADAALIDIEGTVGSIAFVRDVLFPYADRHLDAFVAARGHEPAVASLLEAAAREAGVDPADRGAILAALHGWIASDSKATPLKSLQGLIWTRGYHSGEIRGEIYPDALAALRRFHAGGIKLYVYSSGSIAAQKLVFGHSAQGDLLPLFSGFFDTTTGPKLEPESYERIARTVEIPPDRIVFFSDSVGELDAARITGFHTVQLARPEDGVKAAGSHPSAKSFEGIDVVA